MSAFAFAPSPGGRGNQKSHIFPVPQICVPRHYACAGHSVAGWDSVIFTRLMVNLDPARPVFGEGPMKKLIALLVLSLMIPTLMGCEAKGKVDTDNDSVKVKAKVDTD